MPNIPLGFLNTKAPSESVEMEGRATEFNNLMLREGRLSTRPGTSTYSITGPASAVTGWFRYTYSDGTEYDVIKAKGGPLYWATAGDGSFTAVGSTTGGGATYGSFFQRGNYGYYCNASANLCFYYDGSTWHGRGMGADVIDVAVVTTSNISTGGLSPGKYTYSYAAYDEDARVWGLRSPYGTDYAEMDADNHGVDTVWTSASATLGGVKAAKVILWRAPCELLDGQILQKQPFRMLAGTLNDNAFKDTMSDAFLGDEYAGIGGKPPATDIACWHNDRAYFLVGGTLWFSERGRPEMVAQTDTRTFMSGGKGDPKPWGESQKALAGNGTGLASFANRLFLFTSSETYLLSGDGHRASILPTGWGHGCAFHESIVICRYGMFWMSADGLCWSDGFRCQLISRDSIDFDTTTKSTAITRSAMNGNTPAIGAYDPDHEHVLMSLADDDGTGSWILGYDCRHAGFSRWTFGFESGAASITSMASIRSATSAPKMIFSTASPSNYQLSESVTQDNGTNYTKQWTGWFGQKTINADKTWSSPRMSFLSGNSGTVAITVTAGQSASQSEGNSDSANIDSSAIGPHTPAIGHLYGRLCQIDVKKTVDGALDITELVLQTTKTGGPGATGADKA